MILVLDQVGLDINGRSILKGVTLELALGQHLAVMGPNGAGKSTLLGLIDRVMQRPTSGCLTVFGKPPSRLPAA